MTREEMEAWLGMLQRQRVKTFKGAVFGGSTDGTIEIEFLQPEPRAMPDSKDKKNEADVCLCGHPEHAHMNGFCVEGCDTEKCNPKQDE